MNREELNKILKNHIHWLHKDCEGWRDMRADFHNMDLSWEKLYERNLCGANLYGADLHKADLAATNFHNAELYGANLYGAELYGANLCGADLRRANLCKANLNGANLYGTDLYGEEKIRKGVKLTEDMIGWKKCQEGVIVKLLIPRGAIVFSINNYKCRTDKAKVLEVIGASRGISRHKFMSYYVGDEFEVFDFNCEYNIECETGIHFFRAREEAENYNY